MKKVIFVGILAIFSHPMYAMDTHDTHLETFMERQDHSAVIDADAVIDEGNVGGTAELISANFFDLNSQEIQRHIEESLATVAASRATPAEESGRVVEYLQGQFNARLFNERFTQQLRQQHEAQQAEYQRLLTEREQENRRLQERLNTILRGSTIPEDLRMLDRQRIEAEERVRALQRTLVTTISEPLGADQVDDTLREVNRRVTRLMRDVQDGRRSIEIAVEDTKEHLSDQIHMLSDQLEQRRIAAEREMRDAYTREMDNARDAYERQASVLQQMIDASENLRVKAEKERELADVIHGIYLSNPSNPFLFSRSFIRDNVQEIKAISDLSQRRSRVEALYDKFKLFSSIYGREDLGVKATAADLEAVKSWLGKTHIDAVLNKYGTFKFPKEAENAFNGADIGQPLAQAKARLTAHIDTLESTEKTAVQSQLLSIFQRNAAEDSVSMTWTHPLFWGTRSTHEINYYKNGSHIGYLFQETTGGWWGESWGIFGYSQGHRGSNLDWNVAWNTCRQNFQQDSSVTVAAIKKRAELLFDFETNPESALNKLRQQSGNISSELLIFPVTEIDNLIKQCNDFIKRSIS